MDSHLRISYDIEGDILTIESVPSYAGQETDMTGDGHFARTNPGTGAVEAIDIVSFSSYFSTLGASLYLPFGARFSGLDEGNTPEGHLRKVANE